MGESDVRAIGGGVGDSEDTGQWLGTKCEVVIYTWTNANDITDPRFFTHDYPHAKCVHMNTQAYSYVY